MVAFLYTDVSKWTLYADPEPSIGKVCSTLRTFTNYLLKAAFLLQGYTLLSLWPMLFCIVTDLNIFPTQRSFSGSLRKTLKMDTASQYRDGGWEEMVGGNVGVGVRRPRCGKRSCVEVRNTTENLWCHTHSLSHIWYSYFSLNIVHNYRHSCATVVIFINNAIAALFLLHFPLVKTQVIGQFSQQRCYPFPHPIV